MIEDVFYRYVKDKDPIKWEKGYVFPSDKPGLEFELNEELAEKSIYKRTKLHLKMAEI